MISAETATFMKWGGLGMIASELPEVFNHVFGKNGEQLSVVTPMYLGDTKKKKAQKKHFQIVMVDEPNELDAISILRGLKEKYENHHKVRIKDDAIIAAVQLSTRYITDRFLPDKAIDLMDEAAARLRLQLDSVPESLDEVSRRIKHLEIEREAIKRENDKGKLEQLNKEIADLKDEETKQKAQWQSEKEQMNQYAREMQENKENEKFQ